MAIKSILDSIKEKDIFTIENTAEAIANNIIEEEEVLIVETIQEIRDSLVEDDFMNALIVKDADEQFIYHFQSIDSVDESRFADKNDPIIVYKERGAQVQVSIAPFVPTVKEEKDMLPFKDKVSFFKKKVRDIKNTSIILEEKENDDIVQIKETVYYGTLSDFVNSYNDSYNDNITPTITIDDLFTKYYFDLDPTTYDDFITAYNEAYNTEFVYSKERIIM
jgi:hypothetical protein